MPIDKHISLRDILEGGVSFLQEKGIDEPRRNAEVLLAHIIKKSLHHLYTEDIPVSEKLLNSYHKLLVKRGRGIPLQYLTKTVHFYNYDFRIEKGIFIPRPETEILVEKTIEIYKKYFSSLKRVQILDIGTGCGNIAISLLKEIKTCYVVATDISEKVLEIAYYNAVKHHVENRIIFLKADVFPGERKKFHIIVSNPPYIPQDEIKFLEREVQKEPIRALSGGKDGLSVIKRILTRADDFLFKDGFLLIEIGDRQREHIEKIEKGLLLKTVVKDLAGIERVLVFQKKKD